MENLKFNPTTIHSKTLKPFDKIWLTIEQISGKFINALHGETNGYVFRYLDGTWKRADYEFINSLAGLGDENRDLT